MTLTQQIISITSPLAFLIAIFGGWFAYQLTSGKCNCADFDNKIFMQVIVGMSILLIFTLGLLSLTTFSELTKLGY